MNAESQGEDFCFSLGQHTNLFGTFYPGRQITTFASILYFHGGGFLYGERNDLPFYHLETLRNAGYAVFTFEYRLAPFTKLPDILEDVEKAICWYLKNGEKLIQQKLPYFLWGRSAGAYLCLLTGLKAFSPPPAGIISYYGYGFLAEYWYQAPTSYYSVFPSLEKDITQLLAGSEEIAQAPLRDRYGLYIHARQTGKWYSMFYTGSKDEFYASYTLRNLKNTDDYPPVFLTHAYYDPDVPFEEAKLLSATIPNCEFFYVSSDIHDYDRFTKHRDTKLLIRKTLRFLEKLTKERASLCPNLTAKKKPL